MVTQSTLLSPPLLPQRFPGHKVEYESAANPLRSGQAVRSLSQRTVDAQGTERELMDCASGGTEGSSVVWSATLLGVVRIATCGKTVDAAALISVRVVPLCWALYGGPLSWASSTVTVCTEGGRPGTSSCMPGNGTSTDRSECVATVEGRTTVGTVAISGSS
jgi:hypothetical protein